MLRVKGFNLMELMVAVAIVGILAAVAYPSYNDSVQKSRRADAKAGLTELSHWMERNYSEAFVYNQNSAGAAITAASFPFNKTPKEGPATTKYYDLELAAATANSFLLRATPVGPQSKDKCGKLTLDHTGAKNVEDAALPVEKCW